MKRNINFKRLAFICCCLVFIVSTSEPAFTQPEEMRSVTTIGESEILDVLEVILATQRSNFEKIKTWRGKLQVRDKYYYYGDQAIRQYKVEVRNKNIREGNLQARPLKRGEHRQLEDSSQHLNISNIPDEFFCETEATVLFAIDTLQDKIFVDFNTVSNKYRESGSANELPIKPSFGQVRSIVTPEKYLHFRPGSMYAARFKNIMGSKATRGRAAFIEPTARARGRKWLDIRDPRAYVGDNIPFWQEYSGFKLYLQENKTVPMVGNFPAIKIEKVSDNNNIEYIVTSTSIYGPANEHLHKQTVLDASLGFNPTRVKVLYSNDKLDYIKTWTYQKVGGIFLPKTLVYLKIQKYGAGKGKPLFDSEIIFQEIVLNEPVPDETFTYKNLGLKTGDRVIDKIQALEFTYQNGELIPPDLSR